MSTTTNDPPMNSSPFLSSPHHAPNSFSTSTPHSSSSSSAGWSPLRVSKRDPQTGMPSRIPSAARRSNFSSETPVRRTSASFSHVRNNNLVKNSPFVRNATPPISPPPAPSPRQSRIPALAPRVSDEKKKILQPVDSDTEELPSPAERKQGFKRRQSKGFQNLAQREYVSKSPFRAGLSDGISPSSSTGSLESASLAPRRSDQSDITLSDMSPAIPALDSVDSLSQTPPRPKAMEAIATTPTGTPRSNLKSRRLLGPRASTSSSNSAASRRARRKTVTFDERCDVVEFDNEDFERSEEVFQSDTEIDYDPDGIRLAHPDSEDDETYDSNDPESSFLSEDGIDVDGFVTSILAEEDTFVPRTTGSHVTTSTPPTEPSTPPGSTPRVLPDDSEDGVPYGRSHHAERQRLTALERQSLSGSSPSTPLLVEEAHASPPPSPSPARPLTLQSPALDNQNDSSSPTPPPEIETLQLPTVQTSSPRVSITSTPSPSIPPNPNTPPTAPSSPSMNHLAAESSPLRRDSEMGFRPMLQSHHRTSSSLSSIESASGSISGRASPRINRDEVKRRMLLQNRPPPVDLTVALPNREVEPAIQLPSSPTPPLQHPRPQSLSHQRTSSIMELNKPGVDLGEVRSALDRLMLGVERGFVDESSSFSRDETSFVTEGESSMIYEHSREVDDSYDQSTSHQLLSADHEVGSGSFMDSEADISIDAPMSIDGGPHSTLEPSTSSRLSSFTDASIGEVLGAERAIFVNAETKRPAISPPSPLLSPAASSRPDSMPPSSNSFDRMQEDHHALATPSMTETETETETEGEGPMTPSVQSLSVTSSSKSSSEYHRIPADEEGRFAVPVPKEKPLPDAPQPRLSLDLATVSSFHVEYDEAGASSLDLSSIAVPAIEISQPPASTSNARELLRAHEAAILAKRREARRKERGDMNSDGDGEGDGQYIVPRAERPQRRRSRSVGDFADARGERVVADRGHLLSPSKTPAAEVPLSTSIDEELNKRHETKRKYHLRERSETIYASSTEVKVARIGNTGDIDSGKAWRTVRRPSDLNEYAREIRAFREQEDSSKTHGKVFVKVLGIKSINVPIPRLPTFFTCTLNNGIHFVTTPECRLARDSAIDQEFELIEHNKLEFTLTLKVRRDDHIKAQQARRSAPPPPPAPTPTPAPISITRTRTPPQKSGGMRAFFGSHQRSPKKAKITMPPPPPPPVQPRLPPPPPEVIEDNLARYLRPDGTLARAMVSFKDVAAKCDVHLLETSFPLVSQINGAPDEKSGLKPAGSTSARVVGEIILQMYRVPPLPGLTPNQLPQSLDECLRGMRHIGWHKVTYHEGTLTQNGGDCSSWRRRQFRIVGAKMIAFNDVTKKATVTIELKKALAVEDDNAPSPAAAGSMRRRRPRDSYDAVYKVERSFRLLFPNDEEIEFFADSDAEKEKWLQVFRALVGRIPPNPLWAELVWQRQQELLIGSSPIPHLSQ